MEETKMNNVLEELKNYQRLLNKEAEKFKKETRKDLPKTHHYFAEKQLYLYQNAANMVAKIIDAFNENDPEQIKELEKMLTGLNK